MTHFTAAETYGNLDLVASGDEFFRVVKLGFKIVCVDVKRKTNFRPPAFLRHIYVIFAVFVSFMIFSFTDFEQLKNALELWKMPFFSKETLYYLKNYAGVIIISGVLCTPLIKKLILKLKAQNKYVALLYALEIIACVFLLILCTAFIVDGSYNPFLYFRF